MIIKKEDGTIVDVVESVISTTDIDKKIISLELSKTDLPLLKDTPDKETLELWNNHVLFLQRQAEQIQRKIDDLTAQKKAMNELPVSEIIIQEKAVDVEPIIPTP